MRNKYRTTLHEGAGMIYININREEKLSLSRQIYRSIKESILSGKITEDTKLPSTRELSAELHVARNVVIEGYEQLIAEGYAYSENGSGTYISEGVMMSVVEDEISILQKTEVLSKPEILVSFRTGIPDLGLIPIKKWAQFYHKIALDIEPHQMDYQNSFGDDSLRVTLAQYLNRVRGTNTRPENILITNGAAQSFHLLCQLVSKDEYALVENPLSYGLLHTLESNGVTMRPIRLDKNGMVTAELPSDPPKLIFTTPSHQFPMGSILTASRRIKLINYASSRHAYIVEDDYDSEFRYDGNPIESMQYLAPDRVIYVGTFSKTLMPALRIGYMVLPDELREKMCEAKFVSDIHSPVLEQLTLARFIDSGAFELHIRKMQKVYQKKRNHLIDCLKRTFGDRVHIIGAAAGLHFVCSFTGIKFDSNMLRRIEQSGIEISSIDKHLLPSAIHKEYDNMLIFGYGNTPIEKMETGIELLAEVINESKRVFSI
jgi:GntR family transcriptional regulator/MocR family aminotransferase